MAPGLLIHGIRHPGKRPDLSPVGMPAELEIYSRQFRIFQMIRLVVEKDGKARQGTCKLGERFPARIAPVIPADNSNPLEIRDRVAQQGYPRIGEELLRILLNDKLFVIAEEGKK